MDDIENMMRQSEFSEDYLETKRLDRHHTFIMLRVL